MKKLNFSRKNSLNLKQFVVGLLILSIGLFGVSGYFWYTNVFTDPNRLINDMLGKSMQTSSVYRTVSQKSRQSNVEQNVFVSFSPQLITQSSTRLEEAGRVGESTSVITETIGTSDTDYVRYTGINVPKDTKNRNFDDILNIWGKRQKNDEKGETVTFLNEAIFSIIPFGNLNSEQQKILFDKIKQDKLYSYKKAEKKMVDGRFVMAYEAELNTQKLVGVLAKYIEITGAGDPSQLDPEQYKNAPALRLQFSIDILSRHLSKVVFVDSGREEKYSSYGLERQVEPPKQTISIDELQKRLQKQQ